jgi:inner membrane transporter RhtA
VDRLGAAMLVALVFAMPIGLAEAAPALTSPALLLAGIGEVAPDVWTGS